MWDAIAANRRRSWVLIALMGMVLIGLGATIGGTVFARLEAAAIGGGAALVIWLILWLVALSQGDSILLSSARAKQIGPDDHRQLWNIVEEMKIASGLATMPKIYIITDAVPNAFAIGRSPDKCSVAVTTGLLRRLDRDELQGVIAHEIGHIINRDTRFLMIAGIMLGAIILIAHIFLRSMFYSGGRSRGSSRGGGQAQIILIVLAILLAILAPILAHMLYYACSRRREYLADASGALFTRYPAGLASALEKISAGIVTGRRHRSKNEEQKANKVLAPMYIINPLEAFAAAGMFSTHPPTEKRVAILRSMGGASYSDYETACKSVLKSGCIGARTLKDSAPVACREASAKPSGEEKAKETVERLRDIGLLTGRLDDLVAFSCICGVGIRVPFGSKRSEIRCPRCGKNNKVPSSSSGKERGPQTYHRKGKGWESFRCACGGSVQLSPSFSASHTSCRRCKAKIAIHG